MVDAIIVLLNENSKICPWVRCSFDELLDWFVASDVVDDGCLFNFVYQIASIIGLFSLLLVPYP
jgi:hypothetical protein